MFQTIASRRTRGVALAALLAVAVAAPVLAQSTTGQANFSRYVALGDSLTAAFSSGGLLDQVQNNSYPALISRQTGGSGFQQPTVSAPGIPALLDLATLSPLVIAPRSANTGAPTNLNLARPYDNLAVPGFNVHDVLATPAGNALASFILRPPAFQNASALQQALLLQPTFVSLWIGNNDVLAAATSGIVIDGVTLTPVADFERDYRAIVTAIRARGAQLAVATIPNVTAIPFVTTLPYVVVNPATNQPVLVNGSPVPIIGPNGPLTASDRVLLSASAQLRQGVGIPTALGGRGTPLGTQYVLSASELATIQARLAAYNNVIRTVANDAGAALVDINAIFADVAAHGISYGGVDYNASFLTGGVFSYDGVHPTAFGYAFVANEFLKAINSKFGGKIPLVDLFPFTFGSAGAAGTLTDSEVLGVQFTKRSSENLRRSLNVPTTETLLELLARQPSAPNPPGEAPGDGENHSGNQPTAPQRPEVPRDRGPGPRG